MRSSPIAIDGLLTVLIADDQGSARRALGALLATCPEIEVVAEARDGREAVELAGARRPRVVLMDLQMPEMDGVEATRRIKSRWPEIAVLVLTMHPDRAALAMGAGADAFLVKGRPPGELISALLELSRGPDPLRAGGRRA